MKTLFLLAALFVATPSFANSKVKFVFVCSELFYSPAGAANNLADKLTRKEIIPMGSGFDSSGNNFRTSKVSVKTIKSISAITFTRVDDRQTQACVTVSFE